MTPTLNIGYKRLFLLVFVLCAGLVGLALGDAAFDAVPPGVVAAPDTPDETTLPCTPIIGTVTWTQAGSPYIANCSQTVEVGATLIISPGVEVRFGTTRYLDVRGTIIAIGTATDPITFTGINKTPGTWIGVNIVGTPAAPNTRSVFDHVTMEYGGYPNSYGNLNISYGSATVRHSTFRNSSKYGVATGSGGRANATECAFTGNALGALYIGDAQVNQDLARLTASGNGPYNGMDVNGIVSAVGPLHGDLRWADAGLPYVLPIGFEVAADGQLTVEPGVEVRFDESRGLMVHGRLLALGSASEPITFTGTTATRGWWNGIRFTGYSYAPSVGSQLSHVTVEYGGRASGFGNIYAMWGQVAIDHSLIRYSGSDGVHVDLGGDMVSIESSQIVDNGTGVDHYGILNDSAGYPYFTVMSAPNNWWGDASGPTFGGACTTGGIGSRVSAGVDFLPVLGSPSGDPGTLAPGTALTLVLEPKRWFVPADNSTYAVIVATLRDGAGRPVPGRIVKATTDRGTVASDATTDALGRAQLLVRSSTAGDALITASVDQTGVVCELIRRATTTITFTPFDLGGVLTPGSESPYTAAAISAGPRPLVQGTPALVTVKLTNPYTVPIQVNASLGVAQSGIGMAFVLVDQWDAVRIEASSAVTLTTDYTPLTAGHWCFRLSYAWNHASALGGAGGSGVSILSVLQDGQAETGANENTAPANTHSQDMKAAFGVSSKHVEVQRWGEQTTPPSTSDEQRRDVNQRISDMIPVTREIDREMGGDPPSQDYRTIVQPVKPAVPVYVAGGPEGLTQEQATAVNALFDALADAIANGRAVLASDDRYAGAVEAHDTTWAAQQVAALLHYREQTGLAYLRAADALQSWLNVYAGDRVMSLADAAALQEALSTTGFTTEEVARFTALGCTPAQIEWIRQALIARDPADLTGSVRDYYAQAIEDYRTVGNLLAYPKPTFSQQVRGTSLMGAESEAASDVPGLPGAILAAVTGIDHVIQVGNPLTTTATIALKLRPLGIPANWAMTVSPSSLTLAPGASAPVTITVVPASASVQGTAPRLAVEGYISNVLIGGVALDIVVPTYAPFGEYRVYLPLTVR